jgi:hypothetical protein
LRAKTWAQRGSFSVAVLSSIFVQPGAGAMTILQFALRQ